MSQGYVIRIVLEDADTQEELDGLASMEYETAAVADRAMSTLGDTLEWFDREIIRERERRIAMERERTEA